MIKCFYFKGVLNFGDVLTPIIIKHISGQDIKYVKGNEENKLLAIGSDMNRWLRKNDVVWGYGSRSSEKSGKIIVPEGVKFWAVRGPLTRQTILKDNPNIIVPEIYGDPAILMPLIYKPKTQQLKYKIGIIPHYIDKTLFEIKSEDIKLINVSDNPYKIIDEINQCETIISTSLHGTIVAESYGKKVVWLQVSDRIIGALFKFNDYLSGTGRKYREPIKIMNTLIKDKELLNIKNEVLPNPTFNTKGLINAWGDIDAYIK